MKLEYTKHYYDPFEKLDYKWNKAIAADYLTVSQVVMLSGFSRQHIYNLITKGILTAQMQDGKSVIPCRTFVKWFSEKTKSDWLEKQIVNEYTINQYIVNHFSEADIMNYFWSYLGGAQTGITTCKENASNNTFENAVYCMDILKKEETPVDTMVVVSEWPYLLRAMATTKKQGDMNGIKVLPLPAEGFKYDKKFCMKLLRDEAKKIIQYEDADDVDITKYIRTKVKNGPDYGFDVDDIGGEI